MLHRQENPKHGDGMTKVLRVMEPDNNPGRREPTREAVKIEASEKRKDLELQITRSLHERMTVTVLQQDSFLFASISAC